MTFNKVITWTTAIVVFAIVLIIFGNMFFNLDNALSDKECKNSLSLMEKMANFGDFDGSLIKCIPDEITLKQNDKKNNQILADGMKDCWEKFGKGKLNLFEGDGIFCSVCSFINVEEDVKISNLYDYFEKERPRGMSKTYLEYFQEGTKNHKQVLDEHGDNLKQTTVEKEDFTVDQDYAIIFRNIKGIDSWNRVQRYISSTAEGAGAVALGIGAIKLGSALSTTFYGAAVGIPTILTGTALILGGAVYSIIQYFFTSSDFEWYSQVMLRSYNEKTLNEELLCDYIPTRLIKNE